MWNTKIIIDLDVGTDFNTRYSLEIYCRIKLLQSVYR